MSLTPRVLLAATAVAAFAVSAHAQSVAYSASHLLSTTNWSDTLLLPLFNPALGTLQSVDLILSGTLRGNIRFESQDSAQTTVVTTLDGHIVLTLPDTTVVTSVAPTIQTTDTVAADDGSLDFAGTSGRSHLGLTATLDDFVTYLDPADLAFFTGPGNLALGVRATGASLATGSGNLITFNQTQAGAEVTVVYNYSDARIGVPEPGEWAAMGVLAAGLGGLVARRRRA